MSLLGELSVLHIEVTVTTSGFGLAPGCSSCGVGWPCGSRVLIDRLLEEGSDGLRAVHGPEEAS